MDCDKIASARIWFDAVRETATGQRQSQRIRASASDGQGLHIICNLHVCAADNVIAHPSRISRPPCARHRQPLSDHCLNPAI